MTVLPSTSPRTETPDGEAVAAKPSGSPRHHLDHPVILAVGSALLLWLAFPPVESGYLGWVALVPLFRLVRSDRPPWQVDLAAFAGGLVFWLLAVSWVRLTDPSAWLAWVVMAAFLALWWPGFLALARQAVRRLNLPPMLAIPVIWVGLEYLRAHVLTGFPWYYLAHTQYRALPVIQIADWSGVWGPSFLVALVNAWIVDVWTLPFWRATDRGNRPTSSQLRRLAWVAAAILGTLGYGAFRLATSDFRDGPRIALLQSNFKQELKMGATAEVILGEFQRLIREAVNGTDRPDLLVWPETAYPRGFPVVEPGLDDATWLTWIQAIHPQGTLAWWRNKQALAKAELQDSVDRMGVPMMVGSTAYWFRPDGYSKFNSAILFEPGYRPASGPIVRYDKLHLVPFGEYVPLIDSMPWLTRLTPYHDSEYIPNLHFGAAPAWFRLGAFKLASVICFEDTVPHVTRRFFAEVPDGRQPDVLVNLSNDGWFRGSSELDMHLAVSVFRCVENRVPLVRSVNTGVSAVVDGNGAIQARLPKEVADVLTAVVPLDDRESVYSQVGDWLGLGCLAVTLGLAPLALIRTRARPRTPMIA